MGSRLMLVNIWPPGGSAVGEDYELRSWSFAGESMPLRLLIVMVPPLSSVGLRADLPSLY